MRLRPYISVLDFEVIKNWMPDRRGHALWCADRFVFPINRENFESVISEYAKRNGDYALIATDDGGKPIGFFCYSVNTVTNEGMLKFVIVDPLERGKGIGKEMLRLAVKYAFEITKAEAVRLFVFSVNPAAKRCYESVGFKEVTTAPGAFAFGDEAWGRCSMIIKKQD